MDKRLIIILNLFVSLAIVPLSAKTIRIRENQPLQQQFQYDDVVYKITKEFDLDGKTLVIPKGSTLKFEKKGSLYDGTLSGRFKVKGVRQNSFRVRIKKGSIILSPMPVFDYSPEVNESVMSACVTSIMLMEDIHLDSDLSLACTLYGNGHSITASQKVASVLRITDYQGPSIHLNDVVIKREYSGTINTNYAIVCENSSNIFIKNSTIEGRLRFINNCSPETLERGSRNVQILKSTLTCDLSRCPQGWEYGQDHLAFYSVKDVIIKDCKIVSKNVNRILKTSQYFAEKHYPVVTNGSDNILFLHNTVTGRCNYGKQMWDMFCGTTNVTIEKNTFDLQGFTRFIEDKAYQDKYQDGKIVHSTIRILNNRVTTYGSDLFQFRTSNLSDSFEVEGNTFLMKGQNKNGKTGFERSCGGYLQGYNSVTITNNTFAWEDEAVGLSLFKVNYNCNNTIIENNTFIDAYRIVVSSARNPENQTYIRVSGSLFRYSGNRKEYSDLYRNSREEIYFSDMTMDNMVVDIPDNDMNDSHEVIFAKNILLEDFSYKSKAIKSNSYLRQTESVRWTTFNQRKQ